MDGVRRECGPISLVGAAGREVSGQDLAIELSKLLLDHYPGHQWMVHVNSDGGVIDIKNLVVSPTHGYRILRHDLYAHEALRKEVLRGGGEILERGGLDRGKFREDCEVGFVDGIEKIHQQPAFQDNIAKYAELLEDAPAAGKYRR